MVRRRLLLGDCLGVSRSPRPQQVKVAEVVCGGGRAAAGIAASITSSSLLRLSRAVVAVAVHVCLWEGGRPKRLPGILGWVFNTGGDKAVLGVSQER